MSEKKNVKVIVILILVIVILLVFIAYAFWIKPSINGYIVQKQMEAKDVVLSAILLQIQQQGYAQISDAQGNSILLVPAKQTQQGTQPPQQITQQTQKNSSTK